MTQHLSVLCTRDAREIPTSCEYIIDPAHSKIEFSGR